MTRHTTSVDLPSPLAHTTVFAQVIQNGDLEVVIDDRSQRASNMLGGEVTSVLTVAAEHKTRILARLRGDAQESAPPPDLDEALLRAMAEKLAGYDAVKAWLTDNGVPFTVRLLPFSG